MLFSEEGFFWKQHDPICPLYFLQDICNFLYSVSFPCVLLSEIGEGGTRSQFGHSCIINLLKPFKGELVVQEVHWDFSQSLSASLTLSETPQNLSLNRFPAIRVNENLKCVEAQRVQRLGESDNSLEQ